ncbi:MAG: cellulose biosynthesis cyclic di-GMP-binding regulatory protein BcsB [Cyanobacteria bacterium P01_A01_bin.80]
MKQFFNFSKFSAKTFVIICWFLLSPASLLSAEAARESLQSSKQEELLVAQANISEDEESTDSETNATTSTYSLEFNRAPIVGNRMRLRGLYSQGRLGFTRPRNWEVSSAKALIRFQHSPALFANRSNLTVLVNDTAVGSIPLNRKQSQVGQVLLNIPPKLLQDYNELKIVAQQNNVEGCTNPSDPNLWTEILPDSKLVFNFQRQSAPLNFSTYPYPIFDKLGLENSQLAYLKPNQVTKDWLRGAARLQTSLGRQAEFRPIDTDLITDPSELKPLQKLIIIGTPREQAALADLDLPLSIVGDQILDNSQNPVPSSRGVVMMGKTKKGGNPILVATGNDAAAVEKAVQSLVQPDTSKMGAGQVIFVDSVKEVSSPNPRQWSRYIPEDNSFRLSELKTSTGEKFSDVTVRGAGAPPIEIDFRALPNDRFIRGSSMNLVYSYGPQINPRTSAIQVLLDGNFIGGARLDKDSGEQNKTLKVDLPPKLIKPDSKIQVFFRMNPKEPFDGSSCVYPPDQQLTGTIHNETNFDLKREISVELPNLKLLQYGFPFAAPQDLSETAIVVPQNPTKTDILTLLEFGERLGRLSQAESVQLDVITPETLSNSKSIREKNHIVAIGTWDKLPGQLKKSNGFNLSQNFFRFSGQNKVQVPQDSEGMIKQVISPWNSDRVVLALTAQTQSGLEKVQQVLEQDPWFFQLKKTTTVVSPNEPDAKPYEANSLELKFFDDAPSSRRIEKTNPLSMASRLLQDNWLLLPVGIVGISLLLYGIMQLYLKRLTPDDK